MISQTHSMQNVAKLSLYDLIQTYFEHNQEARAHIEELKKKNRSREFQDKQINTLLMHAIKEGNDEYMDAFIVHGATLKGNLQVDLPGAQLTLDGLAYLSSLTQLHVLILSGSNIKDADLPYLKNLHDLFLLNIKNTEVTEDGIQTHLKELSNVKIIITS